MRLRARRGSRAQARRGHEAAPTRSADGTVRTDDRQDPALPAPDPRRVTVISRFQTRPLTAEWREWCALVALHNRDAEPWHDLDQTFVR
jgi:hypothetical protein